jgi:arylsulfatase A-like enzyme
MQSRTGIRRVVIVVLDGLRPDAIDRFELRHMEHLMSTGASSYLGATISPSVTTAALASMFTGVSPSRHGIMSDRVFIPRSSATLIPLPGLLERSGFPSAAFLAELPVIFRGIGARVGRRLGFGTTRFAGRTATDVLAAAKTTLRTQRRGLVVLHWPDADRAGHEHGWMSTKYAEGCRQLDSALGNLCSAIDLADDPTTMLVALADHGGGGVLATDHESDHPFDRTIPIAFAGLGVVPCALDDARLLDVPPTVLYALGGEPPPNYEGRALTSIFSATDSASAQRDSASESNQVSLMC